MKGDEKLWGILNDKLDMLRASNRLPEAIRVAETALTLAQRAFKPGDPNYTLSLEKLGQLHDQAGDRAAAKPYLVKAHAFLEKAEPPDDRALFRSARRLGFVCDNLGETEAALGYYEAAFKACARLPFARNSIRPPIPTSRNRSATSPWSIIPMGITRAPRSCIAPRLRPGKRPRTSRRKITRSWPRITPIFCVR